MKSNRIIWGIVLLVVLTTIVVSFGTLDSHSQQKSINQSQPTPTPDSGFGDLTKYAVVDYYAPETGTAAEREERRVKNKRYDVSIPVVKEPHQETVAISISDLEPLSPAIPIAESRLIVVGQILNSTAFLSNEKKGIYSEYCLQIQRILKEDRRKKIQTDEYITIDRAGGIVRYPSGQKILYSVDWQRLPEPNGRYLFFLINDDDQNPNYKILTAYQLKNDKVMALDNHPDFREYNGKGETDFIKLVLGKK